VSIPDPHQKSNKLVAAHIKLPKRKHTVMLTLRTITYWDVMFCYII
jgi:hypothetical protein